ncbi:DUF4190 domain-containing protein, partial [Mycolicibacterium sp.]|uniref:DUF4190 domain-containing protein n=1 Tax=Mycolicibacterium sp. TaxID=2320850 RepID=UPI00355ED934
FTRCDEDMTNPNPNPNPDDPNRGESQQPADPFAPIDYPSGYPDPPAYAPPPDYPPPPPGYGAYPPPPAGDYPPPPPGPPGYGAYPGGYGAPYDPYGPPVPMGTNNLATASLVTSIIGALLSLFCCLGGFLPVVGIVLGIAALNQIRQTHQQGRGMAIAGIVIGAITVVLLIVLFMVGVAIGVSGENWSP